MLPTEWIAAYLDSKPPHAARSWLMTLRSLCDFAVKRRWFAENRDFAMLPVEEVNAVTALARLCNMTSINSVLTVDLSGQACSHCLGPQTYSGIGGAFSARPILTR